MDKQSLSSMSHSPSRVCSTLFGGRRVPRKPGNVLHIAPRGVIVNCFFIGFRRAFFRPAPPRHTTPRQRTPHTQHKQQARFPQRNARGLAHTVEKQHARCYCGVNRAGLVERWPLLQARTRTHGKTFRCCHRRVDLCCCSGLSLTRLNHRLFQHVSARP